LKSGFAVPNQRPTPEVTLIRQFASPLSLVYEAWTQPRHLERWFSSVGGIRMEVVEFDFREGGGYHIRYTWGEQTVPLRGKFLTIEREKSLIFTWLLQPPDLDAGKETLVSVWLRTCSNSETEVEVRHALFPDEPMRGRHLAGWMGALNRLGRLLALPD
jgi:uncharacterized protein YndB with AHSA1/START domain